MYDGISYFNGEFRNFVNGKFAEVIDITRYANPEEKIIAENGKWVLSHNGKVFSSHPYDELVWVKDKNRYYGSLYDYSTYIDLTGKEENSIAKQVFDEAYAMSNTNFQEKYTLYCMVIVLDSKNHEGYKSSALNNIGVMYEEAGDEKTALAYYEQSALLGNSHGKNNAESIKLAYYYQSAQQGNSYGKNNAESIRDARAAVERAEKSQRISEALTQISNSLSTISSILQQNNSNNYNYNSTGGGGSSDNNNVRSASRCTKCAGSGSCSKCRGNGYVLSKISQEFVPCSSCNFKGKTPKSKQGKCTYCNGTGQK